LWDGGAGGAGNDDKSIIIVADVIGGINQRWANVQKEMHVNSYVTSRVKPHSVFTKSPNGFLDRIILSIHP
jgi:hypothetical protein